MHWGKIHSWDFNHNVKIYFYFLFYLPVYICLQTLSLSYMTGMLSRYTCICCYILVLIVLSSNLTVFYPRFSFYNTKSVVLCLGITAAVCLLVTVFSFQTKVCKPFFFFLFLTESSELICALHNYLKPFGLHLDGCDILPRGALHLLYGHVPLWSRAGHHPPISICKYPSINEHSKLKV